MSSVQNRPGLETQVAKSPSAAATTPPSVLQGVASTPTPVGNGPKMDTFQSSNRLFAGTLAGSTPAGSTPAGSTPAGSTPASSTPAGSTPGASTPAGSTPAGSTPAGSTPAGSTPAGSTLAGSTAPDPTTPQGIAQTVLKALRDLNAPQELIDAYIEQYKLLGIYTEGGSTPVGSTPTGSTPAGSTPTGSTPVGSTPAGSTPMGSTPIGSTTPGKPGSGGNNAGNPADAPPESPEFSGAGTVDWAKAPANLQALQQDIQSASAKTGVPESIIAATVWQESGANLRVNSTDGGSDVGLMQIDNDTYSHYIAGKNGLPQSAKTPTDPATNILAGATYLKQLKDGPTAGLPGGGGFGTWDMALRAYNSGEYSGVNFSNPDILGPAGRGDVNYLVSIRDHIKKLESGQPPQPRG